MAQLLEGLKTLHGNGISHLDLKADNICIAKRGDHFNLYLIDYGRATFKSNGDNRAWNRNALLDDLKVAAGMINSYMIQAKCGEVDKMYEKELEAMMDKTLEDLSEGHPTDEIFDGLMNFYRVWFSSIAIGDVGKFTTNKINKMTKSWKKEEGDRLIKAHDNFFSDVEMIRSAVSSDVEMIRENFRALEIWMGVLFNGKPTDSVVKGVFSDNNFDLVKAMKQILELPTSKFEIEKSRLEKKLGEIERDIAEKAQRKKRRKKKKGLHVGGFNPFAMRKQPKSRRRLTTELYRCQEM